MPFELYDREVLRQIGEAIGKVLKLDCLSYRGAKPLNNAPFKFVANEGAMVGHQHVREGDQGVRAVLILRVLA